MILLLETMIVKDAAKSTLPTVQIRRGDNESTPLVGDDPGRKTMFWRNIYFAA